MTQPPLRRLGVRIAEIQRATGVPHDSVLRDHALSYMIAGIVAVPAFTEHMVFKGGTALRKCYFAEYRYSEDLDFSTTDLYAWTTEELTELLDVACREAQELAERIDGPYTFSATPERHQEDRSATQHNYRVAVEFPTGARLPVKIELTHVEPIVRPIQQMPLIHGFPGETLQVQVPVYGLDEIAIEKLRALLQTAANLDRREWANRARDLYDLWWLWTRDAPVPWSELVESLRVKAQARDIVFASADDFRDPRVLASYEQSWQSRLANVVPVLPPFEEAAHSLDVILAELFRPVH